MRTNAVLLRVGPKTSSPPSGYLNPVIQSDPPRVAFGDRATDFVVDDGGAKPTGRMVSRPAVHVRRQAPRPLPSRRWRAGATVRLGVYGKGWKCRRSTADAAGTRQPQRQVEAGAVKNLVRNQFRGQEAAE